MVTIEDLSSIHKHLRNQNAFSYISRKYIYLKIRQSSKQNILLISSLSLF